MIPDSLSLFGPQTVTQEVEIPLGNEDEQLGQSLVEYCDDTDGDGFEYNTGSVIFSINQPE
jgi:hypothetical protein